VDPVRFPAWNTGPRASIPWCHRAAHTHHQEDTSAWIRGHQASTGLLRHQPLLTHRTSHGRNTFAYKTREVLTAMRLAERSTQTTPRSSCSLGITGRGRAGHKFQPPALIFVTTAWIAATRARSTPQGWSTPTRSSTSHRTHCSPGPATSGHAMTVLRSWSSIESVTPATSAGAPPWVVMQKLAVSPFAERRIPCGAQDQAVPCLIHRPRWHPDDLFVVQRWRTAAQPLPQTGLDERPQLPRTRFEHGRGRSRSATAVCTRSNPSPRRTRINSMPYVRSKPASAYE
jgi:hypothetical protein